MEEYIIDKYKEYKKVEIQSGYRCKTFLLTNQRNKLIYQVYIGYTEYQARKKEYITNLIKSSTNISQIPEILDCGRNEKFAYLVSEYKDGIEMEKINKNIFNYMTFYKDLSNILVNIHSVDIGDSFGWVSENGVEKRKSFADYIKQEIKRNINRIKLVIGEKKEILAYIESKANDALLMIEQINPLKPVICWYDINSNNILINSNSEITGFLDPGGARFSPKEWDLAFIKMDLCKNKKEFQYFINEYERTKKINNDLLKALSVIVEIDDIAFQLESNTKLPIAFESNFNEIITKII